VLTVLATELLIPDKHCIVLYFILATMKKYEASSIKREMLMTPSPEKLPMKNFGYFPLLQQQEL
jgi:hypothetical protein